MSEEIELIHPSGAHNIRLTKSKSPPTKPTKDAVLANKARRAIEDHAFKRNNSKWDALADDDDEN